MKSLTRIYVSEAEQTLELSQINQCFVEADQLYEAAYAVLDTPPDKPETIHEFSMLKGVADAKLAEARARWELYRKTSLKRERSGANRKD
ncbi:hypothetical protein EGJ27_03735 [Pseudomonas sp. v388]|uniref:hypothetical protein n=1 Tax=Pseudomonas sp. v388 TaxID=2479849 RepID=UPI000F776F31|nr:hypothetical protein [Pseudomonas sp. v388]RRV10732.1 hypothetical protein EGJ27_03735 [Pseudomonas sp. v388]